MLNYLKSNGINLDYNNNPLLGAVYNNVDVEFDSLIGANQINN